MSDLSVQIADDYIAAAKHLKAVESNLDEELQRNKKVVERHRATCDVLQQTATTLVGHGEPPRAAGAASSAATGAGDDDSSASSNKKKAKGSAPAASATGSGGSALKKDGAAFVTRAQLAASFSGVLLLGLIFVH